MSTTIQRAETKFIPDILEMMQEFNAIDNYGFHKETTERNLTYFLENSSVGYLWIIFFDGKIAGYIVLTFGFSFEYQGKDAFIDELFVKKKYRGKGLGEKLMTVAITEASKSGVNALHLEVEQKNTIGKELYRKKGFKDNDRKLLTKILTHI